MNRYKSGGPSQATATTKCQKCLKYGHYSYECTAAQQDRPYTSRPSRTQQLLNPKLAPKITEAKPKVEETKSKDVGSAQPSRKRGRDEPDSPRKRSRSLSTSSSDSVSTISTNLSRSRSRSRSRSPPRERSLDTETRHRRRSNSRDRNRPPRRSGSPYADRSRHDRHADTKRTHSRSRSRSPVRTDKQVHRQRSRSPFREHPGRHGDEYDATGRKKAVPTPVTDAKTRKRSPSPYSKRIALTQSKRGGA